MSSRRLAKDYEKDANPYGSADNHPGFWGKFAHGLNVATGGENRRNWEEMGLQKSLQELLKEQSKRAEQNANAGHINAETPEVAPNAESTRKLQGAEAEHANAETEGLKNPPESWKAIPGVIGPNGEPVEIEDKSGKIRFGDVTGLQQQKQPKPDSPEQQYIDEYRQLHKGSTVAQAERAYSLDTQKPPQAIMLMPGENGGYTAQNIKPGSQVAPGALSTSGLNSMNVPTSQTRAMAETAPKVIDLANRSEQLIDEQIKSLGPAASRWNEFMAGKIGAPNPEFTKLRTNIGLLQTSLMRMHVGARGGEQIMEHFRDLIDAAKQDPQNLKAALDEIKAYAQEVGASGGTGTAKETNEAASRGEAQTFTVGNTRYQIPKDKVEEFKRDHPDAR